MSDKSITIEVDGIELEARPGQMLMEITDKAGIYIPRFCYHEKLTIAANCRMCLVEVEKVPKPMPACATPVMDGMKVRTRSPLAISAQKATMEFLLINHPLDCPICDQGGECELQDLAMSFGRDVSRYAETKRVVQDKDLGPLISTDMTRCIHCTRCIRFGQEIAGIQELGAVGRSEQMEIGTYIERSVDHELSGNVIDLCPVGALNNKPYRFRARAWEMMQRPTVAPHDPVGSNLNAHTLRGRLMRVVPRDNEEINETWISDRDRFSCFGVDNSDRLQHPMIKRDGDWTPAGWEEALESAALGVKRAIDDHGADKFGVLASPSATTEEYFLLQRLARGSGNNNIDHRLRQADFRDAGADPAYPSIGTGLADIDTTDAIFIAGSNLRMEVPILAHRVRKAAIAGGRVSFMNAGQYEYLFPVANYLETGSESLVDHLATLVAAATGKVPDFCKSVADRKSAGKTHKAIIEDLTKADRGLILLGQIAARHPRFADLRVLASALAQATGTTLGFISDGGNSAGAYLAGAVPHREPGGRGVAMPGLTAAGMFKQPLKSYLLFGFEPDADCRDGEAAETALSNGPFVVALTAFVSDSLRTTADVLLPVGTFAETAGSFVNCEGRWQSFAGVSKPIGEARPGWKVLRVLGNRLGLPGFDYNTWNDVAAELKAAVGEPGLSNVITTDRTLEHADDGPDAILDVPIYAIDGLVRRSEPLQNTNDARRIMEDAA